MATRESIPWTDGFVAFAGLMLMLIGSFHALTGIAAIFENEYFVVAPNYLYEVDVTAWGWLHLIFGIVVVARVSASSMSPRGRGWSASCSRP